MKKYLRRAFECTALVIVLVMLAGSVAEFAGASIEAARSKLTSMMDMAESLYSDGVEDERQLAALYQLLTEPSLHPVYRSCAPAFFSRFIGE